MGRIAGSNQANRLLAVHVLLGIGALLLAFGAFVRTWGAAYLGASVVHDAKSHSTELVADGPYRHVRHPLYFASIVSAFGTAMMASRLGFVILVAGLSAFYIRLAGYEEAKMQEQQGEAYREFCRHVPRLGPRSCRAFRQRAQRRIGARHSWVNHSCGDSRWQSAQLLSR